MAVSTLFVDFEELVGYVAFKLGFTPLQSTFSAYTSSQQKDMRRVIDSGMRQFLYPPLVGGRQHQWNFLRVVAFIDLFAATAKADTAGIRNVEPLWDVTNLKARFKSNHNAFRPSLLHQNITVQTLTGDENFRVIEFRSRTLIWVDADWSPSAGGLPVNFSTNMLYSISAGTYGFPDQFGGIDGPMTYGKDITDEPIRIVNEGRIRQMRQVNSHTGIPREAAVRPLWFAGDRASAFVLSVYPEPDKDYQLAYRSNLLINELSANFTPNHPGRMKHSETIIASCLATAEHLIEEERGIEWQRFMERLAASIHEDGRSNRAEFLGYVGDTSDDAAYFRRQDVFTKYEGILYP